MSLYTALYLPALPDPSKDPSRFDLASEDAAEQYVVSRMCKDCQGERRMALAGIKCRPVDEDSEYNYENSAYPACFCEWLILPTEKYEASESFDDLMEAVGAKVVYRKEE